ncbi:MAG: flavin reductase family protein [Anaerolineales bacterium]
MTVEPDVLRIVMRRWTTGVTLVTSCHEGAIHGMTVSSFTSVSLAPPLVLVSLERAARTHRMVLESRRFAVAMLAADQQELSDRFAGRVADELDRFDGVPFERAPSGCPIPEGCLSYLDCTVVATHDAGTHTVYIGEVDDANVLREAPPLVYFDQDYRWLEDLS